MAWPKKEYGKQEADKCYYTLARFKDQFKEAEKQAWAEGRETDALAAHERYNAMLAAMSALVREYDL